MPEAADASALCHPSTGLFFGNTEQYVFNCKTRGD